MKSLTILLAALFFISSNLVLAGTKIHYVHTKHLGAPVAMTDENQDVVWKAKYTPFGKATMNEDPDGDGETVTLNIRLPGQYYDDETGLHYNWHRYYDPTLGRYIISDPIGLNGGINIYGYALQNPVNYIDPDGRIFVVLPFFGVVGSGMFNATPIILFGLTANGALGLANTVSEEITNASIAANAQEVVSAQTAACNNCPESGACESLQNNSENAMNEIFEAIGDGPDVLKDLIPKIPNTGIQ